MTLEQVIEELKSIEEDGNKHNIYYDYTISDIVHYQYNGNQGICRISVYGGKNEERTNSINNT